MLDRPALTLKLDGASYAIKEAAGNQTIFLPRGRHTVVIEGAAPRPAVTAAKLAGRQ